MTEVASLHSACRATMRWSQAEGPDFELPWWQKKKDTALRLQLLRTISRSLQACRSVDAVQGALGIVPPLLEVLHDSIQHSALLAAEDALVELTVQCPADPRVLALAPCCLYCLSVLYNLGTASAAELELTLLGVLCSLAESAAGRVALLCAADVPVSLARYSRHEVLAERALFVLQALADHVGSTAATSVRRWTLTAVAPLPFDGGHCT